MSVREELVKILADDRIGLTTVIIVCEAIAADARFNIWLFDVVKKNASEKKLLAVMDSADDLSSRCDAIIDEFRKGRDLSRFEVVMRDLTLDIVRATQTEI